MNRVYFTVPLVALALFIGAYTWSQRGREQREHARQAALVAEQASKHAAEVAARNVAIEQTRQLQEQLKKDRLEREARETAEREARQTALDARDHAYREQERLARQIERLKRDIANEQEAVNRFQIDKDAALAEQAFLKTLVPQARANIAALEDVLNKIAAAEAARKRASK
jgi:hypothetical protein